MRSVSGTESDPLGALARALLDTAALIRIVPDGIRVAPIKPLQVGSTLATQAVLDRMTLTLGLPEVRIVPDSGPLSAVELAVSRRLALSGHSYGSTPALHEQVAREALAEFPGEAILVPAYDGSALRCWAAGPEDAPAVAVVSACGMPVGLAANWMKALSASYRVVTWESRGMFAAADGTGLGQLNDWSMDAQRDDLLAVLDGFNIPEAHIIGLCGGTVIALAAAAVSHRVMSLSLWHGTYELGEATLKTEHQRDVESLLPMVGRSLEQAAWMHGLLSRPVTLDSLRHDIAHYLIYPYASPEVLRRYGLLNAAITRTDCRPYLNASQPALVVTSEQDTTAHPAASKFIAEHLPRAKLHMLPDGDHLTAFDGGPDLIDLARNFMLDVANPVRRGWHEPGTGCE